MLIAVVIQWTPEARQREGGREFTFSFSSSVSWEA